MLTPGDNGVCDGVVGGREDPFSVPVFHGEMPFSDGEVAEQVACIEELVRENEGEWESGWAEGLGTWHTTGITGNILQFNDVFASLLEDIKPFVSEYAYMLGMVDQELAITDSWVTVTGKGGYHGSHYHDWSYISGVYYPKIPDDGGDLVLKNPFSFEWGFEKKSTPRSDGYPYQKEKVYELTAGDIVLFPSNVEHSVTHNRSDENRHALAFNVRPIEKVP